MCSIKRRVPTNIAAFAALMILFDNVALASGPFIHVSGGGTGAFDEGEELEGFTTQFAVGAIVTDVSVANDCDSALDGLGVGDFTVTDGDDFYVANGTFNCSLMIDSDFLIILGDVLQGRVNDDGSVTLCGLADIPIDTFSGQTFADCPFAVTFRADVSGFTYYDFVTGPTGDAESLVSGNVTIH